MNNILDAVMNIKKYEIYVMPNSKYNGNKINLQGDSLEKYIRNIFAGINIKTTEEEKKEMIKNTFSYLGNSNNPPDLMLKNGEAIEIKKKESIGGHISLNSSFPKDKLYNSDPKITDSCRNCENWKEKNMIYCIGTVDREQAELNSILFIYGNLFCASKDTYEKINRTIKNGIKEINEVIFTETKELGKIKNIDPLGFADLRIRGMWNIKNPNTCLEDVEIKNTDKTNICLLLPKQTYDNYENKGIFENFCESNNLEIKKVKTMNPNNPAQFIDAIKVEYEI